MKIPFRNKSSLASFVLFLILITCCFSLFTNNSYLQILGFIILYAYLGILRPYSLQLIYGFLVFSTTFAFIDPTLMTSKQLLSIGSVYLCLRYDTRPFLQSALLNGIPKYLYFCLFSLIILSTGYNLIGGTYSLGIFDIPRISSFSFDPNYFALFSVFLLLISVRKSQKLPLYFFLVSTQSLVFLLSFLAKDLKYILTLVYFVVISSLFVDFTLDDLLANSNIYLFVSNYFGSDTSNWLHFRALSFDFRFEWASSLIFDGNKLEGIAPHISLFSGFKKNGIVSIFYFSLILLIAYRRSSYIGLLLVQSLGVDVFFGPLCFLVPLYLAL